MSGCFYIDRSRRFGFCDIHCVEGVFGGGRMNVNKKIREIYCEALMEFLGAPYVWGGSSPCGSDCSGSVCAAVSRALGKNLRVTADELYRRYFTENAFSKNAETFSCENFLYAAFFLDGSERAVHVAGWCGFAYMNVSSLEPSKCGALRSESEIKRMYAHLRMAKRGLLI